MRASPFAKLLLPAIFATAAAMLLATQAAGAEPQELQPYAAKPDWWDSVSIEIREGQNARQTAEKSYEPLVQKLRERVKEWDVIGPFDSNDGNPWSVEYPAEKAAFDAKASFPGKSGPASWRKWEEGKPFPFEGVQNDSVFILRASFKTKTAYPLLLVASVHAVEVKVNGANAYSFKGRRGMDERAPDAAPISSARANANVEIVAKLYNSAGSTALAAWLSAAPPPIQLRIKALAEAALRAKPEDQTLESVSGEMASLYQRLDDWTNAAFWRERQLASAKPSERRRIVREWAEMARREPALSQKVIALLENAFNSAAADKDSKAQAASEMLSIMLERNEVNSMLSFLDAKSQEIDVSMPGEAAKFKLKALIRKGDSKQANELLKEMEDSDKGKKLAADKEFQNLKRTVESVNAASIQLPVDWSFDAATRNATKLEQDPVKLKLYNFIRSCLLEKGAFLLDTGDPELFPGALARYKEIFKSHEDAYNQSLEDYFALLKGKLGYSDFMLKSRQALLSLGAKGQPERQASPTRLPGWPEPSPSLPQVQGAFQPMTDLLPGPLDAALELDLVSERLLKSPSIGACSSGAKLFVQNSRQILCLEGAKLLWRRLIPASSLLSPVDENGNRTPFSIFPGQLTPCANGKTVFARMLADGAMRLFALRADSGRTVWSLGDAKTWICSNPVLWRDKLVVVAKTPDNISRYSLIVADAESGKVESAMPLYSTGDMVPFGRGLGSVVFDIFIPPPTIADDIAYINTNAGVLVAADILSGSILWERKYSRIPFTVSDELSRSVAARRPPSPIVGQDSVLFAPLDSLGVILLARDSGKLLAERTGLMWTDIVPLGSPANAALAFAPSGASTISMSSLASIKQESFPAGSAPLAFSPQFLLLKRPGALELLDSSLKSVQKISTPDDFIPVAALKDRILGLQGSSPLPVLGLLAPAQLLSAKDYKPQPQEKLGGQLLDPYLTISGQDAFISSLDRIVKLNQALDVEWSFPIPNFKGAIFQMKDAVFVSNGRRAFVLDKAKGSIRNCFPDYAQPSGSPARRIWAECAGPEKACFATDSQGLWDSVQICSLSANDFQALAPFKSESGHPLAVFNDGQLVLALTRQKALAFFKLQGGAYVKTESQTPIGKDLWTLKCLQIDESQVLIRSYQDSTAYLAKADATVKAVPLAKGNEWNYRFGSSLYDDVRLLDKAFCVKFSMQQANVIDLAKGVDLSATWQTECLPSMMNGLLMGAKRNQGNPKRPYTLSSFDMASGKTICAEEADFSTLGVSRTHARFRYSLEMDGALLSAFGPEGAKESFGSGAIVAQKPGAPGLSVSSFPDCERCTGAICRGENVLLILDGTPRRLSKEDFLSLKASSRLLFEETQDSVDLCLDGFLDEWNMDGFHKIGKNSFRILQGKDSLVVAGLIGDEAALERLGPGGLGGDATLAVLLGDLANLKDASVGEGVQFGLKSSFKTEGEPPFKSAFVMSPAGDSLSFEIEIPYEKLFRDGKFNEWVFTSNPSRKERGDIAFDILVDAQDGSRCGLFSASGLPAFFPRILLPSIKDRAQPVKPAKK